MSCTPLNTVPVLNHLRNHPRYFSHFVDEEIEAHSGYITCPSKPETKWWSPFANTDCS